MSKIKAQDRSKQKGDVIYKLWRLDVEMWEEKIRWYLGLHYYKYSINKNGITFTKTRLWKYPSPVYLEKANTNLPISKDEARKKKEQVDGGTDKKNPS